MTGGSNATFEVEAGRKPWMKNFEPPGKFTSSGPLDFVKFTREKSENLNNQIKDENHEILNDIDACGQHNKV